MRLLCPVTSKRENYIPSAEQFYHLKTTLRFNFLQSFKVCVRNAMLFRYMGRLVTSQRKCHFSLSPLHFVCYLVLYLYAYTFESPELLRFCVSEIRAYKP